MITNKKLENNRLNKEDFLTLERKLEQLMSSNKYVGYRKSVKWAIMAHVFESALDGKDINDNNIDEYCRFYIDNIFYEKN